MSNKFTFWILASKASWCLISPVTKTSAPSWLALYSNPIPEPPMIATFLIDYHVDLYIVRSVY